MNNIDSYILYFKQIASSHKSIKGFYMMDINEVYDSLRSKIEYPALILPSLQGNFYAKNYDNKLDNINGGFMIIDHCNDVGDYPKEMEIIANTKKIGQQIIAKMLYDVEKCETLASKALPGFDVNSVKYKMHGPVFDNDFGVLFEFQMQDVVDLEYQPEMFE